MSQLLSEVTVTSCSFYTDVQCILLAAGRRTQAGDATDRAIAQWRRRLECVVVFKTLDISQGSVTTHLRCGEILVIVILQIFPDYGCEIILKIG